MQCSFTDGVTYIFAFNWVFSLSSRSTSATQQQTRKSASVFRFESHVMFKSTMVAILTRVCDGTNKT